MKVPKRRSFLGKTSSAYKKQFVYETAEGLEIDEANYGYTISRKRVFFDDVMMVSSHDIFGWRYLVITGILASFFGLIGLGLLTDKLTTAALVFSIIASFFLFLFVLRITLRVNVISIYGKRSKAEMHFSLRKNLAHERYKYICDKVRTIQDEIQAKLPPEPVYQEPPITAIPIYIDDIAQPSEPAPPIADGSSKFVILDDE